MPRDVGAVPSTCALGNRQTDLSRAVDLEVTYEQALAPLYHPGPGIPRGHWLRQSPTHKRAFVEVQVSKEDPALEVKKKKKIQVLIHWNE